jgi:hypothetical protein
LSVVLLVNLSKTNHKTDFTPNRAVVSSPSKLFRVQNGRNI